MYIQEHRETFYIINDSECKKRRSRERWNVDVLASRRETDRRGKRQRTYSITGHEPMLTTSENNYKRTLFSFQWRRMNQIVTQSIGIHLKRKIRDKKKRKEERIQLKVERCH